MTAAKVRQIAKTTKKSKAASIKDYFFSELNNSRMTIKRKYFA